MMLRDTVAEQAVLASSEEPAKAPEKKRRSISLSGRGAVMRNESLTEEADCRISLYRRRLGYERLLRLADKLDGVGPYADVGPISRDKFDLTNFYTMDAYTRNAFVSTVDILADELADPACGTAACACGYAGVDPWFRKRGLFAKTTSFGDDFTVSFMNKGIADFFGIVGSRWSYFFVVSSYDVGTPRMVANRIRNFLESSYFDGARP